MAESFGVKKGESVGLELFYEHYLAQHMLIFSACELASLEISAFVRTESSNCLVRLGESVAAGK